MINPYVTVSLQIGAIFLLVGYVYYKARKRDNREPIDDIGVIWMVILTLYAVLPTVSWLAKGGEYGPLDDGRLYSLVPEEREISHFLNIAIGYLMGFCIVYLMLMKRIRRPGPGIIPRVPNFIVISCICVFVVCQVLILSIKGFGLIRRPESYIDAYRVIQELPLGLRQVVKMVSGYSHIVILILLVSLLQRWPRYRWILLFYFAFICFSFDPRGSRSNLVLGLWSAGICWHVLVRPVSAKQLYFFGTVGLSVFLLLGSIRGFGGFSGGSDFTMAQINVGEFDSLLGNALEVLRAKGGEGFFVPLAARLGDLYGFLPNQLLPFSKSTLSDWFLDTYHPLYKEAGGGLAFGAISQAIIGWGIYEAGIRGGILGFILAKMMKWFRTRSYKWWKFPLQLFLLVWIFKSVRNATFEPLELVLQIALPAFVVISVCGDLIKASKHMNMANKSGLTYL